LNSGAPQTAMFLMALPLGRLGRSDVLYAMRVKPMMAWDVRYKPRYSYLHDASVVYDGLDY
jgi:hypothetical protein